MHNTWIDCYAIFALLKSNHPIQSVYTMREAPHEEARHQARPNAIEAAFANLCRVEPHQVQRYRSERGPGKGIALGKVHSLRGMMLEEGPTLWRSWVTYVQK